MGHTFWAERGIALSQLASTTISATVQQLGCEWFVASHHDYHPEVVCEFYAAMIPEVFYTLGLVIVQRHRVEITVDAINEYLQTAVEPDVVYCDGLSPHDHFEDRDERIATTLRYDGTSEWRHTTHDLCQTQMHPDMQLWTDFVKYSLRPSSHRSVISPGTAYTLYSIQQGLPINVGHIVTPPDSVA